MTEFRRDAFAGLWYAVCCLLEGVPAFTETGVLVLGPKETEEFQCARAGWCCLPLGFGLGGLRRIFHPNELTVTFFDVGQGDAALLRTANGEAWLIDGGGGYRTANVGQRVLIPELTRLGVLHVNNVILTHPDGDHISGLFPVLEELRVSRLWINEAEKELIHPRVRRLVDLARVRKTDVRWVSRKIEKELSGGKLTFYPLFGVKNNNARSLIAVWDTGSCRIGFLGDVERAEEQLLLEFGSSLSHIDLIKVAHHGSITSSTEAFLQLSKPKFAVISAGANNRYGHPHKSVIRRLQRHGALVLRTDFHGAVQCVVNNGRVSCRDSFGMSRKLSCSAS